MVKAARRALLASVDQPRSLALLPQYGGAAGALEQLVAFGFTRPEDVLMTLLIADGNPTRHSRTALCSKAIGAVGVAAAPHDDMDQVTLISLAEVWADGLFEEP